MPFLILLGIIVICFLAFKAAKKSDFTFSQFPENVETDWSRYPFQGPTFDGEVIEEAPQLPPPDFMFFEQRPK